MCGVIGVYYPGVPVVLDTILASEFIYHRGHDSSGIAVPHARGINRIADAGFFGDWPQKKREETLNAADRDLVALHIRYSTIGSKETLVRNAQPLVINGSDREGNDKVDLAICHNGHIYSSQVTERPGYETDVKQIAFPIYHELNQGTEPELVAGVTQMMKQTKGSYSFAGYVCSGENILFFFGRDPWGIRPLYWGKMEGGGIAVASEDVPLCNIEVGEKKRYKCVQIKKVPPGSLFIYDGERVHVHEIDCQREMECGFEFVYFSGYGRLGITDSRKSMGKCLWQENPIKADMVAPVPDSGKIYAQGFSEASHIPLVEGCLARNRYKGQRSFIQPTDMLRKKTIKRKITVTREIEGKKVILVDDSIIRGNTMGLVVKETWRARPEELHVLIGSPPICFPCYLGIDMKEMDQFLYIQFAEKLGYDKFHLDIYQDGSIKDEIIAGIGEFLGADSLSYLSYRGLQESLGKNHCFGCWNPRGYPQVFQNDILNIVKKLEHE